MISVRDSDVWEVYINLKDTVRIRLKKSPQYGKPDIYHVALEIMIDVIEGVWATVISYDNYHGRPHHGHRYHPDGSRTSIAGNSPPWEEASNAMPHAKEMIKTMWRRERDRYLAELNAMSEGKDRADRSR